MNTNGNHDRVLSDAQQRLRGVTFIDDAGNTYAPHPDGVEMTPPKPRATADLSSRERSELMDRTVQQVRDLTAACNALHAQVNGLIAGQERSAKWEGSANADLTEHGGRIDALELGIVRFRQRSFLARLRWILTGR